MMRTKKVVGGRPVLNAILSLGRCPLRGFRFCILAKYTCGSPSRKSSDENPSANSKAGYRPTSNCDAVGFSKWLTAGGIWWAVR